MAYTAVLKLSFRDALPFNHVISIVAREVPVKSVKNMNHQKYKVALRSARSKLLELPSVKAMKLKSCGMKE